MARGWPSSRSGHRAWKAALYRVAAWLDHQRANVRRNFARSSGVDPGLIAGAFRDRFRRVVTLAPQMGGGRAGYFWYLSSARSRLPPQSSVLDRPPRRIA